MIRSVSNDFLLVLTSLIEQTQSSQISEQGAVVLLLITFIQRVSLLLPNDAYQMNLYGDVYMFILQRFITPFGLTQVLQHWWDLDGLIYALALISIGLNFLVIVMLLILTLLYRIEVYNPLEPRGLLKVVAIILYNYLMTLEILFYIPLLQLYFGSIVCGANSIIAQQQHGTCDTWYLYGTTLPGLALLMTVVMLSFYFFRTYKYWPDNLLKRKYSILSTVIGALLLLHVFLNYQTNSFVNYLRLLTANIIGVMWICESLLISPYRPPLNYLIFHTAVTYESIVLMLSIGLLNNYETISRPNIAVAVLFSVMLINYLASIIRSTHIIYLIKKVHMDQFQTIQLIQNLRHLTYNQRQGSSSMVWFFAVTHHLQTCTKLDCQEITKRIVLDTAKSYIQMTNGIVQCILRTQLLALSAAKDRTYETLQLFSISFLHEECGDALPAFCQLKIYQMKQAQHSVYFNWAKSTINEQLIKKILMKQHNQHSGLTGEYHEKEIQIVDIQKCDLLIQQFMPMFVDVITKKIDYWLHLLKGYNTMEEFSKCTVRLSTVIQSVQATLEKTLNMDLTNEFVPSKHNNVLVLRILSIFFGYVMNDYEFCYLSENLIDEIMRIERSFSMDLVLNSTLINDQVILMSISTVKNKGEIQFKNKNQTARFFGYQEQKYFMNIKNINQLMPQFVSVRHETIVENYLKVGFTDSFINGKLTFLIDDGGYIFTVNKKLQNFFESTDDYILTAQFSKVKENNEFILFDRYGQILGISKRLFQQITDGFNLDLTLAQLSNLFIFLLFPNISSIIQRQLSDLNSNNNDLFIMEDHTLLSIPKSLKRECELFMQHQREHGNNGKTLQQLLHKETKFSMAKNDTSIRNTELESIAGVRFESDSTIQGFSIPLISKDYVDMISAFLGEVRDVKSGTENSLQFIAKYLIGIKLVGEGQHRMPYFYMEISDIRAKGSNVDSSKLKTKFYIDDTYLNLTHDSAYLDKVTLSEVTPMNLDTDKVNMVFASEKKVFMSKRTEDVRPFSLKLAELSDTDRYGRSELPHIDSSRFSQLLGPMSQRPDFQAPNSQRQQFPFDDYSDIENDFKNLQENQSGLNSVHEARPSQSLSYDQLNNQVSQRGRPLAQIRESEEEIQINEKEVHLSSKRDQFSHQIQRIIMKHRVENIIDQEPENNQSASSRTSMSAKRETLALIKGLRTRTRFNSILKVLSVAYMALVTSVVICMAINVQIIVKNDSNLNSRIEDALTPQQFCEQYYLVLSYGWLFLMEKLGSITVSGYIQTQVDQMTNYIQSIYSAAMLQTYKIYSQIDAQGLIEKVDVNYVTEGTAYNQTFNDFFFISQEKINRVLQMDFLKGEITAEFIESLLYMKENLAAQITVNTELITTISSIFQGMLNDINTQYLVMFVSELLTITILMFVPMILWKQITLQQQRSLMFNSRVHERAAQQNLIRLVAAKEILNQNTLISWKLANYFDLLYEDLDEADIMNFNVDLKQFKTVLMSETEGRGTGANQKNTRNTIITSKIKQLQVSLKNEFVATVLLYLIIVLYLIGGYVIIQQQEKITQPQQQLIVELVKFNLKYETVLITGLMTKTEYLVLPTLLNGSFFLVQQHQALKNLQPEASNIILEEFLGSFDYCNTEFSTVWANVLKENSFSAAAKDELEAYQRESLCVTCYNILPFCQYQDMDKQAFEDEYGQASQSDDDREFMSQGLTGIVSRGFQEMKQSFSYELTSRKYQQDKVQLQDYVNSQMFLLVFIQHFLDYFEPFQRYQKIVVTEMRSTMATNLEDVLAYYLVTGVLVILFLIMTYTYWLLKRNAYIQRLRMGIINIPIDVLFEPQMMLLLKKLDRE